VFLFSATAVLGVSEELEMRERERKRERGGEGEMIEGIKCAA